MRKEEGEFQVNGNIHDAFAKLRMKMLHTYFLNYNKQPKGSKREQIRAVERWLDKHEVYISYKSENNEDFVVSSHSKPLNLDVKCTIEKKYTVIKYEVKYLYGD